jgi:uncharacterized iron-regulated membrane protein
LSAGAIALLFLLLLLQGHDSGLVWYPTTRRLNIHMPNGNPRVLSSSPQHPTSLEQSAAAAQPTTAPATSAASAATISGVLAALALFVAAVLL